jgi:hypothetical protein
MSRMPLGKVTGCAGADTDDSSDSYEEYQQSSTMMGHPRFSALEYAGSLWGEEMKIDAKSEKVFERRVERDGTVSTSSVQEGNRAQHARLDSPSRPVEDHLFSQRIRGTFINHTPRTFEVPSPRRTEIPPSFCDDPRHPYNNSNGTSSSTSSQSGLQISQQFEPNTRNTGEQASSEVSIRPSFKTNGWSPAHEPRATTTRETGTIPCTGKASYIPLRSPSYVSKVVRHKKLSDPFENPKHASGFSGRNGESNNPDQSTTSHQILPRTTAPRVPAPYLPLEPLVAQHRRQVTGSDVDPLPPHVEVENIGQTSAFLAIQQYYLSQESLDEPTNDEQNGLQRASSDELNPFIDHCASATARENLTIPTGTIPRLPDRNPERLCRPTSSHHVAPKSTHSDYISATQYQHSPYDSHRASSGTSFTNEKTSEDLKSLKGRLDNVLKPSPVQGHEQLTANRTRDEGLEDFMYFLKNTGPPETKTKEKKKGKEKKSFVFGFHKVRAKKTLAAQFGSVEGSPAKKKQPPKSCVPTCAREMTTSNGAKHLQIVLPKKEIYGNQVFGLPTINSQGISRRVSISFTEDLLVPPSSSDVEKAISGFNGNGEGDNTTCSSPVSSKTVLRSPKRPITSKANSSNDQAFLRTRAQQTRMRKLRDLQKSKQKLSPPSMGDTVSVSRAPPIPVESPVISASLMESVHGGDDGAERESTMKRMAQLERLVNELARELANAVGMNMSDGVLGPKELLGAVGALRAQ